MNKLRLHTYPKDEKILRTRAQPIKKIEDRHRLLAAQMHSLMKESKGLGLSAPQVGRSISLIVMNTTGQEENGRKLTLYNPEIIEVSEDIQEFNEGCLSFKGKFLMKKRPELVSVLYQDGSGDYIREEFRGLQAVVIQHEIEHLHGILFIDN